MLGDLFLQDFPSWAHPSQRSFQAPPPGNQPAGEIPHKPLIAQGSHQLEACPSPSREQKPLAGHQQQVWKTSQGVLIVSQSCCP